MMGASFGHVDLVHKAIHHPIAGLRYLLGQTPIFLITR